MTLIFVVLGMHKSGTTLVSQILHHSGIAMGDFDEATSYDMGNQYERESCFRLNLDILGAPDHQVLHLPGDAAARLSASQRKAMGEIVTSCEAENPDWGFKDPRSCLTYGLWEEELPEHRLVVVYRNPEQIWPRFKWQGRRKYHTNFHRAYAFLKRWHEHNLNILNILARTDREFMVINYHEFMSSDAGFKGLEQLTGRTLEDRRRPELYRSQVSGDVFLKVADRLLASRRGLTIAQTTDKLDKWALLSAGKQCS